MLTDYVVTCPRAGCHWSGSLLPSADREAWRAAIPATHTVLFRCPRCLGEWSARVVGDDVESLPLEEVALPWA
jgi:hypothetical protein